MTSGAVGTLPSAWWAPALALAERSPASLHTAVTERARRRVARWRTAFGVGNRFDLRLAAVGLDEAGLRRLVDEPAADLAARVERPAWVATAERAVRTAAAHRAGTVPAAGDGDWRAAFAVALRPFAVDAAAALTARAADHAAHLDLPAIVDRFAERLSTRLVRVAARTLAHELNTRLDARTTTGVADFAAGLTDPERLADLFATYPVLARLLAQVSGCHTDAAAELLDRFAADRAELVAALLDGIDPGRLTDVRFGLGDSHRGGRTVAVLSFADGRRVVYKPRDLGAHEWFTTLVRWLDGALPGLGLRAVAALPRDGYGYTAHVEHLPLTDLDAADRFYRRHGALLALLHALHAADIHFENVIACGETPLVVDVETLFHPALPASAEVLDPAARHLADSVQRIGLLPAAVVDDAGAADVSGLGGADVAAEVTDWALDERGALRPVRRTVVYGGARNRPVLDGRDLDVVDHGTALLEGFRAGYDAITRRRPELTDLLETCPDVEVRVAVRHSRGYATLLAESTRPELLRDALDRDEALDLLWTESAHHPLRWRACRYEQADLWSLDVPVFTARPRSPDLWSSTGQRLAGVLERPGLASALAKVAAMSEIDRRDQEWVAAAALATRLPAGGHRLAPPLPGHLAGTAAPPERLLVAACAVADQIVARTLSAGDHLNWLGLELVDDRQWLVLPMGAGLGNGYVGVALFLAQVSELSGVARYADLAHRALRLLPGTLAAIEARPDLVAAVGCGGLHGFGGVAYGLARLTTLLGDDELREPTRTAVRLAGVAARAAGGPGVATGGAGCLAAMRAVHAELGLPEAAALATACADGLAALVRGTGGRCGTDAAGFAEGPAGVGWALREHDPEASRLALAAARPDADDLGWCSGLAGLAAAGVDAAVDTGVDRGMNTGTDTGVETLAPLLTEDRPPSRNLSLCHGELGIMEALTVLGRDPAYFSAHSAAHIAAVRRRRAGLVLDAVDRHGATCGTPDGLPTPGLLTGLAGIGYGLLRTGFVQRVPSVLLLEPSQSVAHTDDRCDATKGTRSRV